MSELTVSAISSAPPRPATTSGTANGTTKPENKPSDDIMDSIDLSDGARLAADLRHADADQDIAQRLKDALAENRQSLSMFDRGMSLFRKALSLFRGF